MSQDKKLSKESFIYILNSMTNKEINEYIKSKGKPPKAVRPILVLRDLQK